MKKNFIKDILGILSSNLFAIIAGLLFGIILARVLGPEGKGVFTSLAVIPTIVVSFAALGIRRASIYHIGKKKHRADTIASAVIIILVGSSTIGIIGSIIAFKLIANPIFSVLLIALTSLIIPFKLSSIYIGGIYIGKENFRFANFLRWIQPLISLLILIILVWILKLGVTGAIISILTGSIVASVIAFSKIFKDFSIDLKIGLTAIKEMLQLGIMYALSLLVMQLIYKIDILILEELSTLQEVGYYSIAVNISEQIWQLPLAIGIIIMSRSANEKKEGEYNTSVTLLLRFSLVCGLAAWAVLHFIAPIIIPIIYGEAFSPASNILQTILPGIVLFIIFRILNSRLDGIGKPTVAIFTVIPALVINIILNYLWIPEFGGQGAAMATNVSYSFAAVLMIISYIKITKTSFTKLFLPQKEDINIIKKVIGKLSHKNE